MKQQKSYGLFLALLGVAMLCLYLLDVPTLSDDIIYRFMWQEDESAPVESIRSLGDVFRSQWTHYMVTNGRWVVHVVAQAFLVFVPPVVLEVINALLFVLLIHLSACWLTANPSRRLFAAVAVSFFVLVVIRGLSTTMLWNIGTFNYLWVLTATMGLLHWMRRRKERPLTVATVLLAPLAFFVGCSHEGLSLPMSMGFAAYLFINRKQPTARRLAIPMLWYMAGTLSVLASPGIWNRSTEGITMLNRFLSGAINLVFNMRVFWLLLLTLAVCWRKDKAAVRKAVSERLPAFVALLAAVGIVVLCGTNLERVCFFVEFISTLLLVEVLTMRVGNVWQRRLAALASVVMLLMFVPACLVRQENHDCWRRAEAQMKAPGRELIAVSFPHGGNKLMDCFRSHYVNPCITFGYYSSYMAFDSTDVNMRCAARLYGKEKLVFLPEDVVSRICHDPTAYTEPELCADQSLYVWQLPDSTTTVSKLTFILDDEDLSRLMPHQRLLAYKEPTYEVDDYRYEVVEVSGRPYLVFTRPMTNIMRRLNHIEYE